ncbi:hypothetical protein D9613_008450 [Agrocybe pediades]|uniref:Brain protein I3 n=1 Tax=Agrocybe pediades TaxID=84607 RepID=A0A8H4QSA6_9AGAR|nr:hypothetical protein D9613_008450 [Agrocybe pediades]
MSQVGVQMKDQTQFSALPPAYPTPNPSYPHPQTPAGVQMDAAAVGQAYRDQLFAECARGNHQRTTSYGICGIITAVVCFPIGLICLFTDSEQKCARCGVILSK